MKKIILILGLPGSGKTTIAEKINNQLIDLGYNTKWLNADVIRKDFDDWDFSYTGRLRQAQRMKHLADQQLEGYIIIDMVAPLPEFRDEIQPNILIWMDTIGQGRYEDTNKMFIPPENYHFRITEFDSDKWSSKILHEITADYIDILLLQ